LVAHVKVHPIEQQTYAKQHMIDYTLLDLLPIAWR
jgi:hypothetical protein